MKVDNITRCFRQPDRRPSMRYLNWNDKVEVMKLCGDSAVILYEYYVNHSSKDNYSYPDEEIGRELGWPTRKVQKLRLDLVKHRFFMKRVFRNQEDRITHYFIGRAEVADNEH